MDCRGAVALVTGGARRVGRAIVLELAAAGCDIALHYRVSGPAAEELAEMVRKAGRKVLLLQKDLADADAPARLVEATVEHFGRLDVLVNNASVFNIDPPEGFKLEFWQRTMQINALAPAGLIAHAAEALAKSGAGKVVNMADIAAERPWGNYQAYCASKAALVAVTRAAAVKLAPHVQVNAVAPGIALFPEAFTPAQHARLLAKVPLQRAGTPEEIARVVRFLVEHGDYITGEVINVDGGRSVV